MTSQGRPPNATKRCHRIHSACAFASAPRKRKRRSFSGFLRSGSVSEISRTSTSSSRNTKRVRRKLRDTRRVFRACARHWHYRNRLRHEQITICDCGRVPRECRRGRRAEFSAREGRLASIRRLQKTRRSRVLGKLQESADSWQGTFEALRRRQLRVCGPAPRNACTTAVASTDRTPGT